MSRMQVEQIISRFGGYSALARAMDLKYPSVAQGWVRRGTIPSRHIPRLLEAARSHNIQITLEDLFPKQKPD
jgi:hypothetical protein